LDVSNPTMPTEVSFYDLPTQGERIGLRCKLTILDNYVYILAGQNQLHILDVSNPTAPVRLETPDRYVNNFFLTNGYLYLSPPLEILEPISLTQIGIYNLPEDFPTKDYQAQIVDIVVLGPRAYANWYLSCAGIDCAVDGWHGVDISEPTRPVNVDEMSDYTGIEFLQPYAVAMVDKLAYLAGGQNGMRLWDISEPNRPIEVDNFEAPGFTLDVAIQDGYIYLANGYGGLYILRYNGQE
jgi:hypothetical protein